MGALKFLDVINKCKDGGSSLEGTEIRNTIVLTFAFQAVFTAFNALQNLHSSLHDEESLGMLCLSAIYGTAVISSVLAPTLIGIVGAKAVLVASFSAHCIYILANFYPSFYTMIPTAVLLGTFHGPAWTSQSLYLSACAFSFSKSSSTSPYTVLSRFNVFFFAVFATTQILGNLVSSIVIRDGVGNRSEMVIFKYCGSDDCPANENATQIEDPEDWVVDITLGFFLACALLGLFLVVFLLKPLPTSDWSQKVKATSSATSCFNVLISTNMTLLVPFIMFTSMEHAILLGAFTRSYIACPIGIHMVGYVMAAYGATTPVFLIIFTQVARVTGRFVLILLALSIHLVLLVILFQWVPTIEDEVAIFVIPMVWGVAESILQAQANALIAMLFPSQKEPAFANFHAWRNVGYTITFMNVGYLCVSTKLIVAMSCLVIGALLYALVEVKTKIQEKASLKETPPVEVEMVQDIAGHVTLRKISTVSSSLSVHDRLSFDRIELADIINEAKGGWRRDGDSFTLELNKVMSKEHLMESKVTTWYHTRPALTDVLNTVVTPRDVAIQRSQSDGHLHSAPYRLGVHAKHRRGDKKNNARATSLDSSKRPKSWAKHGEPVSPGITSIPEDVFEEENEVSGRGRGGQEVKFVIGGFGGSHETEDADHHGGSSTNVSSNGHVGPGGQGEGHTNATHNNFRLSSDSSAHSETTNSPPPNFTLFVEAPEEDQNVDGSHDNQAFEDDVDKTITLEIVNPETKSKGSGAKTKHKPEPLVLLNQLKLNKSKNKLSPTTKTANGGFGDPDRDLKRSPLHSLKFGKSKTKHKSSSDLKGLKRERHKGSLPLSRSHVDFSQHNANNSNYHDYDNDSDGFVDDDEVQDENDNGYYGNIMVYSPKKKKCPVPKMESEDVNCIY
ncbi:uncharacterized protein LOC101850695 [Aplysia californica]|uniref:Uncharacterized protein LOC101850695 n=1 Tax=Aplysia californica TaxID=6500 RepID=A0ABM1W483_APLCA|nr:uncharacterized protein LOC101850695 [Aplysia californica]